MNSYAIATPLSPVLPLAKPPLLMFYDIGKTVGKLEISPDGELAFEGNACLSAKLLMSEVISQNNETLSRLRRERDLALSVVRRALAAGLLDQIGCEGMEADAIAFVEGSVP